MDHLIDLDDRTWFKRCRRAWDLRSPTRQNYVPVEPAQPFDVEAALARGLAAYYYPAMAAWDRALVRPIAMETFVKEMRTQRSGYGGSAAFAQREWTEQLELGSRMLERYFAWAPAVDTFTAVRANEETRVAVPDPEQPELGLRSADGGAIHVRGRLGLLVSDEHDRLWVVLHHFVDGPWTDPDVLCLDPEAGALCWAVESHDVVRVSGVIVNELRWRAPAQTSPPAGLAAGHRGAGLVEDPAGWFRRTRWRKTPAQIAQQRRQLAAEALEMTDPRMAPYPNPSPANCGDCPYHRPCLEINAGADPAPVLQALFRHHVPETIALPPRTGSLGPQVVHGWKTKGPGPRSIPEGA